MNHDPLTLKFSSADDIVYALAAGASGSADPICYAACSSGLFRSDDGGRSWDALQLPKESDEALIATALAVSPQFQQDRSVFAAVKGGILRSSDGGDNWYVAGFPAPPPLFSSLEISANFLHDGSILAGTLEDGVFSSMDRGLRWQPWNFGLFDLRVLSVALSPRLHDDETAFAGTETGLYRSTNGGRAWRLTGFPEGSAPLLSLAILADTDASELIVLAGTESQGLMRSEDSGATWQRTGDSSANAAINQLQVVQREGGGVDAFALADEAILHSTDAGRTWSEIARFDNMPTAMLLPDAKRRDLLLGLQGRGIMRLVL